MQKTCVRIRADQTYNMLKKLISEPRQHFKEIKLNNKLIRRFWRCLKAYTSGASKDTILNLYFSRKPKEKFVAHRKITNTLCFQNRNKFFLVLF